MASAGVELPIWCSSRRSAISTQLGTLRSTLESARFAALLEQYAGEVEIVTQACPGLVEQVEAGELTSAATRELVARYTRPLIERGADTIVLGCTHYPLLRDPIERIVGEGVAVVDSAFTTALATEDLLDALGARAPAGSTPSHRVATTGSVDAFVDVARRLFGDRLPEVESVEIEPVVPFP